MLWNIACTVFWKDNIYYYCMGNILTPLISSGAVGNWFKWKNVATIQHLISALCFHSLSKASVHLGHDFLPSSFTQKLNLCQKVLLSGLIIAFPFSASIVACSYVVKCVWSVLLWLQMETRWDFLQYEILFLSFRLHIYMQEMQIAPQAVYLLLMNRCCTALVCLHPMLIS